MINNSHFIVEFPEKTHSTQYIKGRNNRPTGSLPHHIHPRRQPRPHPTETRSQQSRPLLDSNIPPPGVEVTNCVRGTCCYEYYIRLMWSGGVIPVPGTGMKTAPVAPRRHLLLRRHLYRATLPPPPSNTPSLRFVAPSPVFQTSPFLTFLSTARF